MKKYSTLCIDDVSRHIGKNTRQFVFLDEHARDNKNIAVFYDDKASYSVMESPYCSDSISSSKIAQKWEHISLCTRCKAENYVSWEVMYTLGPVRNRLSITHYDNGGVTIMPPKGKYVHVIGLKTGNKTHLIVNTDSSKLCDIYGDDKASHLGEYGFYCITDDWMSLSRLTQHAVESYMYSCEHDISEIVLGQSPDPEMPPVLFSDYAYSSFVRKAYISSALNEFCGKEGLDLIQVCTRVDNDVDDFHWTEVQIVIGHLDTTVFRPSESGYEPHSNYLVCLDVLKKDSSNEWRVAALYPVGGDALDIDGIISGHVNQHQKNEVSGLSVDSRIEQLMINEVKRIMLEDSK